MVNVALVLSVVTLCVVAFWLGSSVLTRKDLKWYRQMIRYHDTGGRKKLPKIPSWFFSVIWSIMFCIVVFSLYIYYDGNCHFNNFYNYQEDDETGNINWARGLVALIFGSINLLLLSSWTNIFFRRRRFGVAALIIFLALLACIPTLWAIGSTDECRRDYMTNRNWISFGLYLVYSVWLICAFFINLRWARVLGWSKFKKSTDYAAFKHSKITHRHHVKMSRYPVGNHPEHSYRTLFPDLKAAASDLTVGVHQHSTRVIPVQPTYVHGGPNAVYDFGSI